MEGGRILQLLAVMLVVVCLQSVDGQNRDCRRRKNPGRCQERMIRYFYDVKWEKCRSFIYGGCGGNGNNFDSLDECNSECSQDYVCQLPPKTGPCRASFRMFHYDSESGDCQSFTYGGCKGNENRFTSLTECRKRCAS